MPIFYSDISGVIGSARSLGLAPEISVACQTLGFIPLFLLLAANKAEQHKLAPAIRIGTPPRTFAGFKVQPKPAGLYTKTCHPDQGIPFLVGFIPLDQETFGREKSAPIPKAGFTTQTLNLSLRELLKDRDQYEFKQEGPILIFSAKNADSQAKKKLKFQINLLAGKTPDDSYQDSSHIYRKPGWWQGTNDSFLTALDKLYEVKVESAKGAEDLKVIAKDGKIITGDVDLLWVAVPTELMTKYKRDITQKHLFEPLNSAEPSELEKLVQNFIVLKSDITQEKLHSEEMSNLAKELDVAANNAGIITPLELIFVKLINEQLSERKILYKNLNLFQHGPETNNPGEISSLEGTILHFYKNQIVLTEGENDLIDFILQNDYLKEYFVKVHPNWSMEKWAPVIERQIAHQQDDFIDPNTLAKYQEHLATKLSIGMVNEIKSLGWKGSILSSGLFNRGHHHSPRDLGETSPDKKVGKR